MVVSGCDASPVLQPAEHALKAIALFVKLGVILDWLLAVLAAGDARLDMACDQRLANGSMGSDHCKLVKILFQLNETKRYSIGNIFLCLQLRLCTCHDIYQDRVLRRLDH